MNTLKLIKIGSTNKRPEDCHQTVLLVQVSKDRIYDLLGDYLGMLPFTEDGQYRAKLWICAKKVEYVMLLERFTGRYCDYDISCGGEISEPSHPGIPANKKRKMSKNYS